MRKEMSISVLSGEHLNDFQCHTPDFIFVGEYNPGNGTNYKAIAVKWSSDANFNHLGAINPGGWLVVNCNNGLAYLFQEKGALMDDYIQEKIGGLPDDYPYFGDLVRQLISRDE